MHLDAGSLSVLQGPDAGTPDVFKESGNRIQLICAHHDLFGDLSGLPESMHEISSLMGVWQEVGGSSSSNLAGPAPQLPFQNRQVQH